MKNQFTSFLVLVCCLIFSICRDIQGATLYVSKAGNDTTAAADKEDSPYLTVGAALAASMNGDEVHIKPGTYVVTPGISTNETIPWVAPLQLNKKANIKIIGTGRGVLIYGSGPGTFFTIDDCTNIVVQNITFEGDHPAIAEGVPLFTMVGLRYNNDTVTFQQCRFFGYGNHAISHLWEPKTSVNVTVTGCYFYGGGATNVATLDVDGSAVSGIGSNWRILTNVVDNCLRGFEIEGPASICTNILIQGNLLTNMLDIGIMIFANGGDSTHYADITIADNRFYNYNQDWLYGVGIYLTGGERLSVLRNQIYNTRGNGIALDANFADVRDCLVQDNIVEGAGWRGIQVFDSPTHKLELVKIVGNQVKSCVNAGILACGHDITIANNTCLENEGGIQVTTEFGPTTGMLIQSNITTSTADPPTQWYGIWLDSGVYRAQLSNNIVTNNLNFDVLDEGIETNYGLPQIVHVDYDFSKHVAIIDGLMVPGQTCTLEASSLLGQWSKIVPITSDPYGRFTIKRELSVVYPVRIYRISSQ